MANNRDTESGVKRKRNDLTLERKIEILDEWNRCGKVSTTTQICGITRRHLDKLIRQEKKIRETVASSPSSSSRKRITSDIRHVNKRKPGQVLGGTDVSSSTKKTKIDTDQLLQIPDEEGSHIEVKPKVTELDTETDIRVVKEVTFKPKNSAASPKQSITPSSYRLRRSTSSPTADITELVIIADEPDKEDFDVFGGNTTELSDTIITDPPSVASTDLCISSPQVYDAAMGLMSLQSPEQELIIRSEELIQHEPLSQEQVEMLSSHLNKYVLPQNQTKSGLHALILYTTDYREGAIAEAKDLEDSFKMLGFDTRSIKWTTTNDLKSKIQVTVDKLKSQCCMLVVSIMSHGCNGSLKGSDGSTVPVNDILHLFTQDVPAQIPMVMIIQACQSFDALSAQVECINLDMANPGNPDEDKRIVLMRPHTVLLLSTMTGGSALRGAYTGALASQFRLADGKTDIHTMHCEAVKEMRSTEPEQVPEYRCTLLRGTLILPKSKGVNCSM